MSCVDHVLNRADLVLDDEDRQRFNQNENLQDA